MKKNVRIISEEKHGFSREELLTMLQLHASPDGKQLLLAAADRMQHWIVDDDGAKVRRVCETNADGLVMLGFLGDVPVALFGDREVHRVAAAPGAAAAKPKSAPLMKNILACDFDSGRFMVKTRRGVACIERKSFDAEPRELWTLDDVESAWFAMDGTAVSITYRDADEGDLAVVDVDTGDELGSLYDNPDDGCILVNKHLHLACSVDLTRNDDGTALGDTPEQLVGVAKHAVVGIKDVVGDTKTVVFDPITGAVRCRYDGWHEPAALDVDDGRSAIAAQQHFKDGPGAETDFTEIVRLGLKTKKRDVIGTVPFAVDELVVRPNGNIVVVGPTSVHVLAVPG